MRPVPGWVAGVQAPMGAERNSPEPKCHQKAGARVNGGGGNRDGGREMGGTGRRRWRGGKRDGMKAVEGVRKGRGKGAGDVGTGLSPQRSPGQVSGGH